MRITLSVIFLLFFCLQEANCAEFGEYQYRQYLGLQQQLQNQRARAIRNQRRYNQSPTRNIRYPSAGNPYPNISRTYTPQVNAKQRYSRNYYQNYYR